MGIQVPTNAASQCHLAVVYISCFKKCSQNIQNYLVSAQEKELFNFYGDRKKELINVSRDTVFLGGMEAEVGKE